MNTPTATPRDAATVVIVRDRGTGPEVLLLQRAERGDHNSGAWVFPGGLVDPGDRAFGSLADGGSDERASAMLGVPRGGLAYYLAAIRECFEESGVLLAVDAQGRLPALDEATRAALAPLRDELKNGALTLVQVCERFGLRPAPQLLHYVGHWLTPMGRAKRFDTRFFLAVVPPGQAALHDAQETLDHVWLPAAEALSPGNARRLMTPTRAMLEQVLPFPTAQALQAALQAPRTVARVLPRLALDESGLRPVLPHEPAYAELARLDPQGRCDAWCVLRPHVAVPLGAHVTRVSAGADGGNSYLVRSGGGVTVLDPASPDAAHVDALLAAAAPEGIGRIVLSTGDAVRQAAAQRLHERCGAPVMDRPDALDEPDLALHRTSTALCALHVPDGIAFAPDARSLPPQWHGLAGWIAPLHGFLQPVSAPT
jgi:8-oxo-dGTP pyrophosphatase MutT (NUDIX family)